MSSSVHRIRAWLAILAFTATFGLGVSASGHFGFDDDTACGRPPLGNGHPTVQFETAKTTPRATHCPFCHWQRAVSGASIVAANSLLVHFGPVD